MKNLIAAAKSALVFSALVGVSLYAVPAAAQSAPAQASLPAGAVASVNGVIIDKKAVDVAVAAGLAQGQSDTPEYRNAIKAELIARELFWQEAQKRGLERAPEVSAALLQARQSVLIDALIRDDLAKKPITDAELNAEYQRQLAVLEGSTNAQQYQIRDAALGSEADALAVIASVRSGASFPSVVKEKSLNPEREGLLDWLLPSQMVPAIANVIVNLGEGSLAAAPIKVNNVWHVIRVEGKRKFVPPSLDQSKDALRSALQQKRRIDLLNELFRKA